MKIENLKNIIQSSHINFLIGSGLSRPFLNTLGSIENWLTQLSVSDKKNTQLKAITVNILAKYFETVMWPCVIVPKVDKDRVATIESYKDLLKIWNEIVANRHINLLDKQINIFTTNIDDLVEEAAESLGIEFNAGFKGQYRPIFDEGSFSNIICKVSPLFHNTASVPVFNYLKVHGSINWISTSDNLITYDLQYKLLNQLTEDLKVLRSRDLLFDFNDYNEICDIVARDSKKIGNNSAVLDKFLKDYSKLIMVNPRKDKFRETVIDLHFYELMRLYSNALERQNSVLFVAGFSFADEHISQITIRSANANPTLIVIVFAHSTDAKEMIKNNLKAGGRTINNNIIVLDPSEYVYGVEETYKERVKELDKFDLASINKYVFEVVSNLIK